MGHRTSCHRARLAGSGQRRRGGRAGLGTPRGLRPRAAWAKCGRLRGEAIPRVEPHYSRTRVKLGTRGVGGPAQAERNENRAAEEETRFVGCQLISQAQAPRGKRGGPQPEPRLPPRGPPDPARRRAAGLGVLILKFTEQGFAVTSCLPFLSLSLFHLSLSLSALRTVKVLNDKKQNLRFCVLSLNVSSPKSRYQVLFKRCDGVDALCKPCTRPGRDPLLLALQALALVPEIGPSALPSESLLERPPCGHESGLASGARRRPAPSAVRCASPPDSALTGALSWGNLGTNLRS